MEQFKVIQGCQGYAVSNMGNVKNLYSGSILKGTVCKGYKSVGIVDDNNKKKKTMIHRLVAEHFLQNPNNCGYVIHINGINADNRACNLKWVDNSFPFTKEHKENINSKQQLKNEYVPREHKGIYYKKSTNMYRAMVFENSEVHHIGMFNTIEEAKKAQQKFFSNKEFRREVIDRKTFLKELEQEEENYEKLEAEFEKLNKGIKF